MGICKYNCGCYKYLDNRLRQKHDWLKVGGVKNS